MSGDVLIEVHGLAFHAFHGVRDHEKANGQRFVLDLVLEPLGDAGTASDDLADTVSYSEASDIAVELATTRRFDLIERLAAAVAEELLARLPLASATVRVHKPQAPIRHEFADIVVSVTRTHRTVS
jgi:dihydroneopterin aldolase